MKSICARLFLVLLLVATVAGCSSDDDAIDLNGNWTFTFSGGYADEPSPWRIVQSGTGITISYDMTGINIVFVGTCDPQAGTFVATFAAQNQTFSGSSADGDVINGNWATGTDSGTFVGIRR